MNIVKLWLQFLFAPVLMPFWKALAGGALLGGLLGTQRSRTNQDMTSYVNLGELDPNAKYAEQSMMNQFKGLEELLGYGPGQQDVSGALASGRDLASLLRNYTGQPTQADYTQARDYTSNIFAPQQQSLNKAFQDQTVEANRMASRLGRRTDDATLQAMLRNNQANQQAALDAQKTAFNAQYLEQLPINRFNVQLQGQGLLDQLSNQATQNRQNLLGLGQNIYQFGQNFRLSSAGRQTMGGTTQPGAGFLGGALGGMATGAGIYSMMGGGAGGGAGAGAGANPFAGQGSGLFKGLFG